MSNGKNADHLIVSFDNMEKQIITTPNAPAPIGPYSQAVKMGNFVFTSGQIALDPHTMELRTGDIATETRLVMENLKAVLHAAGTDFPNVVKTSIFLMDMQDFTAVNTVYGEYFDDATAPARETVQVAGLPKGVNVEISMIAAI
ncbi:MULTISPECIES: RidA family protein [unclassified Flavobacterium]|uniref:RidA family protein n=1 Tax=unclassified Flavobacterium TaxID=196869 RepID=UPI001F133FB4|nr:MULTISPECIES: RidA family protein [unclassified Flavobacterium]UMY65062.1 RidA family protein [Flavobacterium sp. HJ-32-4]